MSKVKSQTCQAVPRCGEAQRCGLWKFLRSDGIGSGLAARPEHPARCPGGRDPRTRARVGVRRGTPQPAAEVGIRARVALAEGLGLEFVHELLEELVVHFLVLAFQEDLAGVAAVLA